MKHLFTTLLCLSACTIGLNAQHQHDEYLHCGTTEAMQKVFAEHPEIKADFEAREALAEDADRIAFANGYRQQESSSQSMPPVYIIPIVFHIIHDYGTENISDAQILDEVRILNEDFRKLNADTSLIVPTFQGIADDAEIEFRLANIDPQGNCTNGIDRIASVETYIGDDGSKLNPWPRNKYLNVWVVKTISSGAAGYAYLPGTAPSANADGIIILSTYVGSIGTGNVGTSRALTHEIGHFLNLQHVWGSSNNPGVSCGNDGVSDTPMTKGWTSCNLTNNDVCVNNVEENVQNFMEYAYCSRMFTTGQRTRMRNALNAGAGQRNQLWTSTNLTATGVNNSPPNVCAPKADFFPNTAVYVCAGNSLNFTDLSWNGTPTVWNWSFPGGTPSSSSAQHPAVQYNTPGTYDVTLTSTNASGSDTKTRTGLIVVLPGTAQYTQWYYSESFENSTTVSNDWIIENPTGGQAFTRTTTAGYTGTASMRLNNYSNASGNIDDIISPSVDLSLIPQPGFTFRYAFRQKGTGNTDKLRVLVSTNCGQTWTQRWLKSGQSLSTVTGTQSTAYTPASSTDWRQETVNILSYVNNTNVRFMFEFTSGGGNNIYIEDVNITSATAIADPAASLQSFDVFPNPASENAVTSIVLTDRQNINLRVYDMTGRETATLANGDYAAGSHNFTLETASLSKGIYLLRLELNGRSLTQKLIVR